MSYTYFTLAAATYAFPRAFVYAESSIPRSIDRRVAPLSLRAFLAIQKWWDGGMVDRPAIKRCFRVVLYDNLWISCLFLSPFFSIYSQSFLINAVVVPLLLSVCSSACHLLRSKVQNWVPANIKRFVAPSESSRPIVESPEVLKGRFTVLKKHLDKRGLEWNALDWWKVISFHQEQDCLDLETDSGCSAIAYSLERLAADCPSIKEEKLYQLLTTFNKIPECLHGEPYFKDEKNHCLFTFMPIRFPARTIWEKGVNYEKEALTKWVEDNDSDPRTRRPMGHTNVLPNVGVRILIEYYLAGHRVVTMLETLTSLQRDENTLEIQITIDRLKKQAKIINQKRALLEIQLEYTGSLGDQKVIPEFLRWHPFFIQWTCPLIKFPIRNPCRDPNTGIIYEKWALTKWVKQIQESPPSFCHQDDDTGNWYSGKNEWNAWMMEQLKGAEESQDPQQPLKVDQLEDCPDLRKKITCQLELESHLLPKEWTEAVRDQDKELDTSLKPVPGRQKYKYFIELLSLKYLGKREFNIPVRQFWELQGQGHLEGKPIWKRFKELEQRDCTGKVSIKERQKDISSFTNDPSVSRDICPVTQAAIQHPLRDPYSGIVYEGKVLKYWVEIHGCCPTRLDQPLSVAELEKCEKVQQPLDSSNGLLRDPITGIVYEKPALEKWVKAFNCSPIEQDKKLSIEELEEVKESLRPSSRFSWLNCSPIGEGKGLSIEELETVKGPLRPSSRRISRLLDAVESVFKEFMEIPPAER